MRVLVTRPQPEAAALRARLERLGHDVLVDPLLTVEFLDTPLPDAPTAPAIQAVLVTSRNALRALARRPEALKALTEKPIFVVGPATAALARDLGFARVVEGAGTASDLLALVRRHCAAASGPLLVLTGEVATFDLSGALAAVGLTVHTVVLYRTMPAAHLQPETIAAFRGGRIDAVTLMSTRTAQTYVTLIQRHALQDQIGNVAHVCLSEGIARALAPLGVTHVSIARHPNVEELLALVGGDDKCLP